MRNVFLTFFSVLFILFSFRPPVKYQLFDVHLHGSKEPAAQLKVLEEAGVYKTAVSTSWHLQQAYQSNSSVSILHGLMVPCPNGKVPYSLQTCFDDGSEWPRLSWVEEQIKKNRIHFIGEVLSQYHGISSSDSLQMPYYRLAEKYNIPVGIHTGSAGPDHGCPNFSEKMGNPLLMSSLLEKHPHLKVWIMHAGAPYVDEAIRIMKKYPQVYTDISAINNPRIIPEEAFSAIVKQFIDNELEDRVMFGSDNADISISINSILRLSFLSDTQKQKIFSKNAERFFSGIKQP